jgi:proteasome accessory factor A
MREAGIAADVSMFKTSTDPARNSPGCRENYQVGRPGEFGRLAGLLIPFLVTWQVMRLASASTCRSAHGYSVCYSSGGG